MGQENQRVMEVLAKRFNLTDPDPEEEEYILTPQEEQSLIQHAISRAKEHKAFRLADKGASSDDIEKIISETDWAQEVDQKKIFSEANSCKQQDRWHSEQRANEKKEIQEKQRLLEEKCTANYMFRLMQWTSRNKFEKKLIVNEETKKIITVLCYFLSRDKRFETEFGYSLQKGLLIRGISGLGKTFLVQCLCENELNPVNILSMIDISESMKQDGEYTVSLDGKKILYLDDVGTEESVMHYGTRINFFKNFIEQVYLRNKIFNQLMFSTNNSFSELEEKYGFRVRSRMKDMFNIVDVTGTDMRGK